MSIIKWAPLVGPSWLDEAERSFGDWPTMVGGFTPALDVYQDQDHVIVEAPLAGIDPAKVDIAIEDGVLTIKGESEKKSEVEEKDYYRKEVRSGSFYRAVQLPTKVVGEEAKAVYEKGILTIKIPKAAEVKPKTIKIQMTGQ